MPLAKSLNRKRFAFALWAALALDSPALAQGGQAGVDVRVGYGADATRVVIDSPVPVSSLREDSAPGEVDLMLRGPDAGIALQGEGHGLVRTWRLDAGEGGSRLTLDLNHKSRVVRTFLIPPGADTTMYRYVVDLARADDVAAKPPTVTPRVIAAAPKTAPIYPNVEVIAQYPVPVTPRADQIRSAAQSAAPQSPSKDAMDVAAVSRVPHRTARLVREPAVNAPPAIAEHARSEFLAKATQSTLETTTAAPAGAKHERPVHLALAERKVIVIDAGHGGHDPGAQSDGENEKDITLAAALHLRHRLLRDGRYRVVMTRNSDVFVPLEERVRIARRAGADLFIALHADSAGDNGATHGASVYTLSGHGETRVKEVLTGREWFNRAAPHSDPAVKGILLDLTQRSTLNRSNEFAQVLVDRLSEKIDVLPKSHRDAGYFVLLAPDVPAVLLEMGFITSPADQARLTDPARRNALMDTVGDAIDQYFRGDVRVAES